MIIIVWRIERPVRAVGDRMVGLPSRADHYSGAHRPTTFDEHKSRRVNMFMFPRLCRRASQSLLPEPWSPASRSSSSASPPSSRPRCAPSPETSRSRTRSRTTTPASLLETLAPPGKTVRVYDCLPPCLSVASRKRPN